jgi:hypothetical protein
MLLLLLVEGQRKSFVISISLGLVRILLRQLAFHTLWNALG